MFLLLEEMPGKGITMVVLPDHHWPMPELWKDERVDEADTKL